SLMLRLPQRSTLFPYTTLFRSLGDRTSSLGLIGCLFESLLIRSWDFRPDFQVHPGDGKAGALFFNFHRSLGIDTVRREARAAQLPRERHGKTARMGRCDQLLGISTDAAFETGTEGILGIGQHTAVT